MAQKAAPVIDERERSRVAGDYYVSDVFEFQTYTADGVFLKQVRDSRSLAGGR